MTVAPDGQPPAARTTPRAAAAPLPRPPLPSKRNASRAGRLPLTGSGRRQSVPGAVWTFGTFFWAVSFGALRNFVWADLRRGLIDLRGIATSTRVLIWLGLVLLALMVSALLLNDAWRAYSPLMAMPSNHGMAGRGALLPTTLVPSTLFLLAVAWSFVLAGALHCHWLIRLGALAVYLLATASWANNPGS